MLSKKNFLSPLAIPVQLLYNTDTKHKGGTFMKFLEGFFDVIGEILAVLLVVVYVVSLANAQWGFITNATVLNILSILRTYGALLLVGVVGMEAMSKRTFLIQLIFYILMAIIVVFLFFPATYQNLIGLIG